MPMRPVRVIFFYKDSDGETIEPYGCPEEIEFPQFFFAEQVTNKLIHIALIDKLKAYELPDGSSVSWTIEDDVPEGVVH